MRASACLALAAAVVAVSACGSGSGPKGRRTADGLVGETTDSAFARDVLAAAEPTVVYYWAHGCLPCVFMARDVQRCAARYAGKVVFWKLNMGWSARRVQRYRVRHVPTLLFYRGGQEVARLEGRPESAVSDSLAKFVLAGFGSGP